MIRIFRKALVTAAAFVLGQRMARGSSTHETPQKATADPRSELKTFLKRFAMLVPALAVVGLLVAVSGIIPLKASSGHWDITAWFLNFTMERSVKLHSVGISTPELDDPVLVLKGAGHYENGCMPCHGRPGMEHPRIPRRMTPHPPYLPERIPNWDSEELFYIVKHGMKFTGMPAWPAQTRDDEVWAVVAFLLEMPELDEKSYRQLVEGGADAASAVPTVDTTSGISAPVEGLVQPEPARPAVEPVIVSDRCGRCHGMDGGGREVGAFPKLAGQRPHYLFASMKAYADGDRHSGIMQPIAAALSEEEMREIAYYYSRLSADAALPATSDSAAVRLGEQIAHSGIPQRRVPSCADCHGPGSLPRNPFYPNLAGQYASYIKLQLELFQDDRRGGSVYAQLMHPTADDLTAEQMRAVALYYESLARR